MNIIKYIAGSFLFFLPLLHNFSNLYAQVGCMDPEAMNYSSNATIDSENCIYPVDCTDDDEDFIMIHALGSSTDSSIVYLTNSNFEDTISSWTITAHTRFHGVCLNPDSCYILHVHKPEYLANSHVFWMRNEDESLYAITAGGPYNPYIATFNVSGIDCGYPGCMDPQALNYNSAATINFGCDYCEEEEVIVKADMRFAGSADWAIYQNDSLIDWGYFYSDDNDLEQISCLQDGCYELRLSTDGPTDYWNFHNISLIHEGVTLASGFVSHDGLAVIPFGINTSGCTDENEVYGCSNPIASNYNPAVTVYDGSCDLYNDLCEFSFDFILDTLNENSIHIHPNIYAPSYPISIVWKFAGIEEEVISLNPDVTLSGDGPFNVCGTMYMWQNFDPSLPYQGPTCISSFCDSLYLEEFGLTGAGTIQLLVPDIDSGIRDDWEEHVKIYPNPTTNYISVTISEGYELDLITITNISGKTVFQTSPDIKKQHHTLDVNNLKPGVYIMTIENEMNRIYQKIVIQ